MRIAIPCEQDEIFQHFGHASAFKLYETDEEKILSSQVIEAEGSGHSAMAELLSAHQVDVVICGGIGDGAQAALAQLGIVLFPGITGRADDAVLALLKGELLPDSADCSEDEGHSCCGEGSCHDEGSESESCGGGCGGCGGCGRRMPDITGKNVGKTCSVHYRGTFNDGTQFDSSYDRGEPMSFVCGAGMMIRGFDAAVANMEVGEVLNIHLNPEDAYGMADPRAIFTVELAQLPGAEELTVGQQVYLSTESGQPFPVRVAAKDDTTITFDANHEMAGKELNFSIELISVQ